MRHSEALKTGGPRPQSTKRVQQSKEVPHSISSGLSLPGPPPPLSSVTPEALFYVRDHDAIQTQAADVRAGWSAPLAGNLLEEEPWNSESAFCRPRQPSKISEAVAKQVGRLELCTPTRPNRLLEQAVACSENTQDQRCEDKSSAQRIGSGRANLGNAGRPTDADVTKGTRPKSVNHGQPSFKIGTSDDNFFACICCKHKTLCARLNNVDPNTIQVCTRVHDERNVRRGLAKRHVRRDDDQGEKGAITDRMHKSLNGEKHRLAKKLARESGLRGREAEIFQYREAFALLYPAYEHIKHLINPYGYEDPELDMATLRIAENWWPPLNASFITNSSRVAAPPQSHHSSGVFSSQANTPVVGSQQAARALTADRQCPRSKRARQHSPDSPTWAQVVRNAGGTQANFGRTVDPSAQRAARIPAPSNQGSLQPHHRSPVAHKSFGREQSSYWSQPHNQSSMYPPLPTSDFDQSHSGQEDRRPLQTTPNDLSSDTDMLPPFAGGVTDYSFYHGFQPMDCASPRIPGHSSKVPSLLRTDSTPQSSMPESTPGITYGTGSSYTGHTSYYGPPTPMEPVTPTPQHGEDFQGLCIDPRLLEKQPLDNVPKNIDTDILSGLETPPAISNYGSGRSGDRRRQ